MNHSYSGETFSERVKKVIKSIPSGKVATYGQVAFLAGYFGYAKQVAYILHSSSKKDNLPWQRVINAKGKISLGQGKGFEQQKKLLLEEGVVFDHNNRIDLDRFMWDPDLF